MDTFLPWAALGAAALALLLTRRPWAAETAARAEGGPTPFWQGWVASRPRYVAALLVPLLMIGAGVLWQKDLPALIEAGYGAAVGALAVIATHVAGLALGERARSMLVPVGFAAAAGGAAILFETERAAVFLGVAFGACAAGSLVGGIWARTCALLIAATCAAGVLGVHRDDLPRAVGAGVLLLVMAVPCLGIANAWGEFAGKQSGRGDARFWPTVIVAALLIGAAKLAAAKPRFHEISLLVSKR